MSSIDDETVWKRARDGDGEAFGVIFDRHRARLRRHASGLCPTHADADDVVAIAFFEAWRKRDDVRFVEGSMLPWLLRTATYTASNLRRSCRRYRDALGRLPADIHSADHADVIGDGDALTALRELSLSDQQVVTLCVLEQLTIEEAARVLNTRTGTVKSRLSRAKAKLRAQLDSPKVFLNEGVTDVR